MSEYSAIKINASGSFPDGQPLSEISDRFELRDYQGPVSRVEAWIEGDQLKVSAKIVAPDSDSRDEILISYTNACDVSLPPFTSDRLHYFGVSLRETLRWITLHELDENLRVDGKFVVDPHPETKAA